MKKTKINKTIGQPTLYKKDYCEKLIHHMSQGLSIEAFAGLVGVNQDTVHEWAKVHPEFMEAKKNGTALSLLFWEKLGIQGIMGKIPGFNAAAYIFNMKHRFKWRDKTEHEFSFTLIDKMTEEEIRDSI